MAAARSFRTEQIRNVVVLGHGGSGKTTLIDAVCFAAGTSRRKGNVGAGTALTMTTPEETGHGMSMQLTVAHAIREGTKVNLLDTPGYMDFVGDATAAARVADAALVTVSATSGVEVGTEMVWQLCDDRELPRMIFMSMMDKMHANFGKVLNEIREELAPGAIPVQIPIGAASTFKGVVNLLTNKAYAYKAGSTTGEYEEIPIPDEVADDVENWQTELMETLATTDEELLDRYLEGEEISLDEQLAALAGAVAEGEVVPVFCGAAEQSFGVRELTEMMVALLPHPARPAKSRPPTEAATPSSCGPPTTRA